MASVHADEGDKMMERPGEYTETDAGKRDKSSVAYGLSDLETSGGHSCRNCRFSYDGSDGRRCWRVKGIIRPMDWCMLWEAHRDEGPAAATGKG